MVVNKIKRALVHFLLAFLLLLEMSEGNGFKNLRFGIFGRLTLFKVNSLKVSKITLSISNALIFRSLLSRKRFQGESDQLETRK